VQLTVGNGDHSFDGGSCPEAYVARSFSNQPGASLITFTPTGYSGRSVSSSGNQYDTIPFTARR
jgi:hypothetical protein